MDDTNLLENQPIAWTPTPEVIERSQLMRFMKQVGIETWDELYQFSIRNVECFTEEVLKFLDIKFNPPYEKLLDTADGIEFPEWFRSEPPASAGGQFDRDGSTNWPPAHAGGSDLPHAGLNITEMCLDRWQTEEMKEQPAMIWEGEEGVVRSVTYSELFEMVEALAAGLRQRSFGKGDAIGIHLPMTIETVVTLLAINRIGAIAVPVFSGYGVEAIASRLNAVQAKALFSCDGFPRRGKHFDAYSVAVEAVSHSPTVRELFVVGRVDSEAIPKLIDGLAFPYDYLADDGYDSPEELLGAEPTSAEDPLIILYTSGTTGKPKGIVHTHASFPIKAAQDMAFGTDVGKGTRICWYTDIGWMMGPWLIYGALINGATICIYDGAPDYPTPDRMWEFCAKHKVEILGISPTLVRSLAVSEPPASAGGQFDAVSSPNWPPAYAGGSDKPPHARHDLSSLRMFASTGEPWNPAPWWWLFKEVGNSKLPMINYSGGTEIAGGILMGNLLLPQKPCSFPAPCLGMDVDILDENGQPVGPNQVGELVIKQPWIGMARGFWQERERYLETYWSRFKNIWVHGDWAMRDNDGHWFILGRSDDTLKVAGKRVGPAEVESLLVAHPLVTEAAVIGVPDETKGTAMVAFCVPSGDFSPQRRRDAEKKAETRPVGSVSPDTTELEKELKTLIAKDMGKPLAPSKIHFVSALPKTRNAKVMRRVIRAAYLGEDPGDLSALENPQTVDEIRNLSP
jgi:acetyl-CoA synthetase